MEGLLGSLFQSSRLSRREKKSNQSYGFGWRKAAVDWTGSIGVLSGQFGIHQYHLSKRPRLGRVGPSDLTEQYRDFH